MKTKDLRKLLNLKKNDVIITAWAEPAEGPGWSNTPVRVLVRDGDGGYRVECLQPGEQPAGITRLLYALSAMAHAELVGALNDEVRTWKK